MKDESITMKARKNLADTVFDRLHRAIKSGAYAAGDRLPTEHELAAEFQVSRPVIRDALQRLRDQDLVYSKRGAGSFVRQAGLREPLGFEPLESISDLRNCYEFRLTIEPAAACAAARHRAERHLAVVQQALDDMRDATMRQRHREDADFAFHLGVAQASENPYFATAMEALKDHIAVGMQFHGKSLKRSSTGLADVYAEHLAIFDAIRSGQGELARERMYRHLDGSRERLFDGRPRNE